MNNILSSFIDTVITRNIRSDNNKLEILENIKIQDKVDIKYGYNIENVKNNINMNVYHLYENHLISINNKMPINNIINGGYLYCFRNNYIYYLDKVNNKIILKRMVFDKSVDYNDNNFTLLYNECAENIHYIKLNVNCEDCEQIYVNDTNNFIFLFLKNIETIVVYDVTNLTENYILLPSNSDYDDFIISNDGEDLVQIARLYCFNNILKKVDIYTINANSYLITLVDTIDINKTIKKNVLYNNNIFLSLTEDDDVLINFNNNNKISMVSDILPYGYILQNNSLKRIIANKMNQINILDYEINVLNHYLSITNINDNKPTIVLTYE